MCNGCEFIKKIQKIEDLLFELRKETDLLDLINLLRGIFQAEKCSNMCSHYLGASCAYVINASCANRCDCECVPTCQLLLVVVLRSFHFTFKF